MIEKLRALRLTRAADLVEAAVEETLAYYAFPEESLAAASAPAIRSSASARNQTAYARRGRVPGRSIAR